jgi:trigger factor
MSEQDRKSRLVDVGPSRKELELEIPSEEVEKEYAKVLSRYAARVKLPGFRKGRAPQDMVRNLFDGDVLQDVYDAVIPRALDAELKGRGLVPVNVPEVRGIKHEHGRPLSCTVAFEVLPDFDLPDYRSIKVPEQPASIDEAEVQRALEDIQAKAAEYVPVCGRGVEEGDYVVTEIQGRDVRTKRLMPMEKAVVLAGHADNEAALNEALRGQMAGETRLFRVSYPRGHANKRVAGKDVEYTLKVSEVKEKKTPALNDDFAKSLGEYADLNDLRDKIRRELREVRERSTRNAMASAVLRQIADRISLELPESVVEQETLTVLNRMLSSAREGRVSAEALEALRAQARAQAVEHMRNHLILERIARKEGFQVTEEEVHGEIQALAQANKVSEKALAEMVARENRRSEIEETLLFRKTVDFLVKSAIIK